MNNSAFNNIQYGLFVLTATENGKHNGCIINTAMQVTNTPNRIAVTVNKENFTHDMIARTSLFTLSIISEAASFDLFRHFGFSSGADTDKFLNFPAHKDAKNGTKIITDGTNAYISASVTSSVDLDTHTMFIADVTDADILTSDPSATYDYYHLNIKPAPNENRGAETVWRCKICNYEYHGKVIPPDYICPLCKHPASDFEKI